MSGYSGTVYVCPSGSSVEYIGTYGYTVGGGIFGIGIASLVEQVLLAKASLIILLKN